MRRLSILVLALCTTAAFAQRVTTKDGRQILPEEGDWSIAIDANPFLDYIGNFIGGVDANSAPTWNYLTQLQTITGKYMVTEEMAYRATVRIGLTSGSDVVLVAQEGATPPTYPDLPSLVENKMKMSATNVGVAGGIEWRKGQGRLQGIYGGEFGIGISSSKTKYEYGNEIDPAVGVNGFRDDFGTGNITTDTYGNTARITEMKSGATFGVGARGFIGAEYFLLPKLSLGGEFGWGLVFTSTGSSKVMQESTDGTIVGQQELEGSKSSSFGVDSDNNNTLFGPAGVLRISFYF
jgi:hypothetical protein